MMFGATGPVDADLRRPHVDWVHTAQDQGALLRNYTKWDDQPASVARAVRSDPARQADRLHRAEGADLHLHRRRYAGGAPRRAGRVSRSGALHARTLAGPIPANARRDRAPLAGGEAAAAADRPRVTQDRRTGIAASASRRRSAPRSSVSCAPERISRPSIRCNVYPPRYTPNKDTLALMRQADVILSLDSVDLGGWCKLMDAPA